MQSETPAPSDAETEATGGDKDLRRKITGEVARTFVLAGDARFTLVSLKTGARFTYRVQAAEDPADTRLFVGVLTDSNNETDFTYLGTIFDRTRFCHGKRSRIGKDAPSALAFAWAWPLILQCKELRNAELWHEGRCGRCARVLTVPESVDAGIGPLCATKMGRGRSAEQRA